MEAPSKANEIKAAMTGVFAFGTALWGVKGWAFIILMACMVVDYITGTVVAVNKGEWSSTVARNGLWHKFGEIAALLVATLSDISINLVLQQSGVEILQGINIPHAGFTLIVAFWYIFTELGSIIENVSDLGAPVPKFLINYLKKLKDKAEEEKEKE